jgi:hypothetical protein
MQYNAPSKAQNPWKTLKSFRHTSVYFQENRDSLPFQHKHEWRVTQNREIVESSIVMDQVGPQVPAKAPHSCEINNPAEEFSK